MQNFTFRSRNIILPNNFLNFSSHFQENFFFVLINNFGLYEDTMIFFNRPNEKVGFRLDPHNLEMEPQIKIH